MLRIWPVLKDMVQGYINDGCLSKGASIAYYTVFSLAPLLIIATAIAGLVFGEEAVRGALDDQLQSILGSEAAQAVQEMIKGASEKTAGVFAAIVGIFTLFFTASGAFGELQASLNAIWKVPEDQQPTDTVSQFVKAKAASIGLVAATGFLLLVSLVVSAGVSAVSTWILGFLPAVNILLVVLNFLLSLAMITALFAAMYKVLPDRKMAWKDVWVGALFTAFLFVVGKTFIGWYLGSGAIGTSYGAASALVILLVWVYYSSQIFLMGAEFTRAYAGLVGSQQKNPVPAISEEYPVSPPSAFRGYATFFAGALLGFLLARRKP